jgi:hypothetical protein
MWPLLIVSLTLLGLLFQINNSWFTSQLLIWLGAIIVQVVVIVHSALQLDQMIYIRYIEQRLRPLVETAIGKQHFWKFEHYQRTNRGTPLILWQWFPVLASLVALAVASYMRLPWSWSDCIGFLVSGVGVFVALILSIRVYKTLRDSFASSD